MGTELFSGITFKLNKGDRIGLIGKNGAGKSTLLKVLSKDIESSAGTMAFDKDVQIGFLRQDIDFVEGRTILEEAYQAFEEIKLIELQLDEINEQLATRTDYESEEYSQWVIEDKFASDFPDLSLVGATITNDLEPYEETKIRILNGGHTALAYLGVLSGYDTFDQVMNNEVHRNHFKQLQKEEIIPSIEMELPFDIDEYVEKIEERLSSSANHDELERICMDGFTKFHTFVVPTLRVCLAQGKKPIHMYKSIAAWYIYARKAAKGCTKIRYNEPNWSLLEPLLREGKFDDFVSSERLWGDIPKNHITFSRDLKTLLMSQTYEKEIDILGED